MKLKPKKDIYDTVIDSLIRMIDDNKIGSSIDAICLTYKIKGAIGMAKAIMDMAEDENDA